MLQNISVKIIDNFGFPVIAYMVNIVDNTNAPFIIITSYLFISKYLTKHLYISFILGLSSIILLYTFPSCSTDFSKASLFSSENVLFITQEFLTITIDTTIISTIVNNSLIPVRDLYFSFTSLKKLLSLFLLFSSSFINLLFSEISFCITFSSVFITFKI